MKKRTVGDLTHADFGKTVEVEGYPPGTLWGVHHVAVLDGSAEPFTRLLIQAHKGDVGTKGVPPQTPVRTERSAA